MKKILLLTLIMFVFIVHFRYDQACPGKTLTLKSFNIDQYGQILTGITEDGHNVTIPTNSILWVEEK